MRLLLWLLIPLCLLGCEGSIFDDDDDVRLTTEPSEEYRVPMNLPPSFRQHMQRFKV